MKTIVLSLRAAKDLDDLPEFARQDVTSALIAYAVDGHGDVKKLAGRDGYRLRVGRYRVLFEENQTSVVAIYIGKR